MDHVYRAQDNDEDDYIVDEDGNTARDRNTIRQQTPGNSISTAAVNRFTPPSRAYAIDENLAVRMRVRQPFAPLVRSTFASADGTWPG